MIRYEQKQYCSAIGLIFMLTLAAFFVYFAVIYFHWLYIGVALLLLITTSVFMSLTVRIDGARLRLTYGPGFPRITFPPADITSARVMRNKWWYGWGIKLTPHGWCVNIAGLVAVELVMTSVKLYRIGSAEPSQLAQAVRSQEAVLALASTPLRHHA